MSRRQQRARHARRKQANAKMRALGVAGGVAVASLGAAGSARAGQTYQVTTTADVGTGSLRDAITQANANPGSDTITFAAGVTGEIRPQTDLPALTGDLTIDGPGAQSLTLNGQNDPGAQAMLSAGDHDLTVSGLTITNDNTGAVSESGADGGLALNGVVIQSNGGPIPAAGGIGVSGGGLTVTHSTLAGNIGTTAGGILVSGAVPVTVEDSTFAGNTSAGSGGAINLQNTGATTIADSTLLDNFAGSGHGGGGIEVGASSALTLENSVLTGDTGTTHPDLDVATGGKATVKFSLIGTSGDVTQSGVTADSVSGTLKGMPAGLDNVDSNGGQTRTALPTPGSLLVNAGKEFAGETTDQRGATRTVGTPTDGGDGTDIGAVERQPVPTVTGISPSNGSAGDTVTITGTNFGPVEEVRFGTVAATSFTVVNSTTITAVVPVLTSLPSAVNVTVLEAEGTSATSPADQFSGTVGVHTYEVTNLSDNGSGSLRDAITQANAHPGNDTVTFASGLTGSIALATDLPYLTTGLNIQGPGARQLAVDAAGIAGTGRATLVENSYRGGLGALTVSGLTFEHGYSGSVEAYKEPLTLDGVTVTGDGSPPAAHDRVHAVAGGQAATVIEHSTITGTIGNTGAALYSYYGTLDVRDSTVSGNQQGGYGGIGSYGATVTVDDSTVTGNAGSFGAGGITLTHGGSLKLHDSVVAGNTTDASTGHPDVDLQGGATATAGYSLLGQNPATAETGLTLDGTDIAGKEPKLGPLQNNGGPTDTELPQPGSPLLDAGNAFGLAVDQRGLTRPSDLAGTANAGDGSDIGAVEVQAPAVTGVSPASAATGSTVTITGSGFTGATGVGFGSTAASSVHVVDDHHVTAVVPAGSGTVDVRVTTPYGPTAIAAADHFTYPTPVVIPPPSSRPVVSGLSAHTGSSGQTLRISGSHLTGASVVRFGSAKAKFKVVSDGSISSTVPSSHGRVDVEVTGPGGTSAAGIPDRFSYLAAAIGHHGASARWKGSNVIVDSGMFASCPRGGDRCSVSAKATSVVPASLARVRKAKTKSLTLGSARFHVNAGKRGEVTFTLTRKGLKALEKLGKLKITVTVTVVDGSVTTKQSRTITIHLPKKPKPKKK